MAKKNRYLASVLRSGGMYKPEHANLLASSLEQHNPGAHLHLLTDFPADNFRANITAIPFVYDWRHWWAKIELFRPRLFDGPVLYFDLDTIIVGDVSGIQPQGFTMLRCVYKPLEVGSGVLAWDGGDPHQYNHLYSRFIRNPEFYMSHYNCSNRWGDQAFIRDNLGHRPNVFGTECRSYKVHCLNGVPEGTKIVYFHGRPKPWEVTLKI